MVNGQIREFLGDSSRPSGAEAALKEQVRDADDLAGDTELGPRKSRIFTTFRYFERMFRDVSAYYI
jgi:hypothetical protein